MSTYCLRLSLKFASLKETWVIWVLLCCLAAVLMLPYLGENRLVHEEPRRAIIAENMIQSGNYWVPMLMDEVYTAKPPLYNWLIVATSWLQGSIDEFNARISSWICLLLLSGFMLFRLRHRLSLLGILFLGSAVTFAPELINKGTLAEIELVFTLLVSLSLWIWFSAYEQGKRGFDLWLLPAVVVAFSFLTKREPALVFYYFSIAGFLIYKKEFKTLFSIAHIVSALITLGIIGFWIWQMIAAVGLDALIHSSTDEVVNRGLEASVFSKIKNALFYPVEVWIAAVPFSLPLLALFVKDIRTHLKKKYGDLYWFCLIAVLINLPIYLIRGDIAVRYYLPMVPTMLVLSAMVFETYVSEDVTKLNIGMNRLYRMLAILVLSVCLILNLVLWRDELGFPGKPEVLLPEGLDYILAAVALLVAVWRVRSVLNNPKEHALWLSIGFIVLYRIVYFDVLFPRELEKLDRERNLPVFIEQINNNMPKDAFPLQTYKEVPRDFWYYMGYGNLVTEHKTGRSIPKDYVVTFSSYIPELEAKGFTVKTLATLYYRGQTLIFGLIKEK